MFEPRNRPSNLRIDEREYREEIDIGIEIVKDEKIMDGIADERGRQRDALGTRELGTLPQEHERGTEERKVQHECRQAACRKPIDERIMRPVEPRLLRVQ